MENKTEMENTRSNINIGIGESERKEICQELSKCLADTYLLYLKTQNYHWNVTGRMFHSLHTLFEEQYKELASSIDEIAERIRALGEFSPGSFSKFAKLTSIKEEDSIPAAEEMISNLIEANESVLATAKETLQKAEQCSDDGTVDLMVERLQAHEKNAWMLRSLISGAPQTQASSASH